MTSSRQSAGEGWKVPRRGRSTSRTEAGRLLANVVSLNVMDQVLESGAGVVLTESRAQPITDGGGVLNTERKAR